MNILKKSVLHFKMITAHKIEVARACFKTGLYLQAFTHDLSKYSLSEFIEYSQYYNGKISPVDKAKQTKGYCLAWMHHKGHNPHHYEYWIDSLDTGGAPLMMPYKYVMELVCDYIGAGRVYKKGAWTHSSPLEFWEWKKQTAKIHPKTARFLDAVLREYAGTAGKSLNKKRTRQLYAQICKYSK